MIAENKSFFIKSFRFLQQEVMASFRPCPDCAKRGVVSPIVPRRITEEVAVWKCNNPSCIYPMSQSLDVFKAQFVPVSTIDERLFTRYVNYEVRSESCCSDVASVDGGDVSGALSPPLEPDTVSPGAAAQSPRFDDFVSSYQPQPLVAASSAGVCAAKVAPPVDSVVRPATRVATAAPSAAGVFHSPRMVRADEPTAPSPFVASAADDNSMEPLVVHIGEETLLEEERSFAENGGVKANVSSASKILPEKKLVTAAPSLFVTTPPLRLPAPQTNQQSSSPAVAQRHAPPFSVARLTADPSGAYGQDDPTARRKRLRLAAPSSSSSHSSTSDQPPAKRRPSPPTAAATSANNLSANDDVIKNPHYNYDVIRMADDDISRKVSVGAGAGVGQTSQHQRPSAVALLKHWRREKAASAAVSASAQSAGGFGSTKNKSLPNMERVFMRSKLAKSLVTSTSGTAPQQDASNFASFPTPAGARPHFSANRFSPTVTSASCLPPNQSFPAYASSWRGPPACTTTTTNSLSDDGSDKQSTSSQPKNIGSSLLSSGVKKTLKSNIIGQFGPGNNHSPPSNVSPPIQTVPGAPPAPIQLRPYNAQFANQSTTDVPFLTNQFQPIQDGFATPPATSNINYTGLTPVYGAGANNYSNIDLQTNQNNSFGVANIFSPLDDIFGFAEGSDDNKSILFGDPSAASFLTPFDDNSPIVYEELGRMNF